VEFGFRLTVEIVFFSLPDPNLMTWNPFAPSEIEGAK